MKNFDHIISLGNTCYTRSFPEKFELQEKFPIRMPFDGSVHSYQAVCHVINNDFSDYCNERTAIQFKDGNGNLRLRHEYLHIKWVHEKNLDIEDLIENNKKRVSQFLSILRSEAKILFFITWHDIPTELVNIIKIKYPRLIFKIFVLDWSVYDTIRSPVYDKYFTYVNLPRYFPIEYLYEKKNDNYEPLITYEKELLKHLKNELFE